MNAPSNFEFRDGIIRVDKDVLKITYTKTLANRLFKKSISIPILAIKSITSIRTAPEITALVYYNDKKVILYFSKQSSVLMRFIEQLLKDNHSIKVIEKLEENPCESDTCCYYKNE